MGATSNVYSIADDLYRSVNNQYRYFTIGPTSSATIGAAIAAVSAGWDWTIWGLMVALFWIGDSGINSLDLSAEDINLQVNARVQRVASYAMVAVAVALGVALAWMTTWLFLVLVALMAFLGVAYARELFDGLLHDRDYPTGVANLSVTLGLLPMVSGYLLMAGTVSLGVVLVGIGRSLHNGALHVLEDDTRTLKYERLGIEHDRDPDESFERLQRRVLLEHRLHLYAYGFTAAGLLVEFVLLA